MCSLQVLLISSNFFDSSNGSSFELLLLPAASEAVSVLSETTIRHPKKIAHTAAYLHYPQHDGLYVKERIELEISGLWMIKSQKKQIP